MANKPKRYDLKAADRRRSRLIQFGLTAIVILFAVGMVLLITKPWEAKITAHPISVAVQDKLIKNPDGKPKAVVSIYEDFLCPHCGEFEKAFGPTMKQLIDTGAVQANYFMLALPSLDQRDGYSSRAGNAAYCVADADPSPNKDAFRRFHDILYSQQPSETDAAFPKNDALIEHARVAGLETNSALKDCINNGKYTKMVKDIISTEGVAGTPTLRLNGKPLIESDKNGMPLPGTVKTPEEMIKKITDITGPVGGLTAVPPPPAEPAPSQPAPAGAPPAGQ